MFHLNVKPSPPTSVGRETPGQAVRLLGDHHDAGLCRVDDGVQLLQERDGVQVLAAAEAVREPLARLARVVEIEHRRDRVDPEPVGVELLEPVERVREEEVPHLVAPEVEDERAPVGVRAAARVGVLVQRRPVEARERPVVAREVRRDPVEDDPDPPPVQRVDERAQVVGRAQGGLRGVVPRHLVAPRRAERVLHHRHQLHVREPELLHVVAELVGEVAPPEALPPRARMHLVGGHRRAERIGSAPPRQPVVVRPRVARAVDDRRGGGRLLGAERERVGLETRDAVGAVDRELVGMALARMRGDACPDPRRLLRLEDVRHPRPRSSSRPRTDTARAFGAHTAKRTPASSASSGCAPRRSHSRSCRPSPRRWRSSSPSTPGRLT